MTALTTETAASLFTEYEIVVLWGRRQKPIRVKVLDSQDPAHPRDDWQGVPLLAMPPYRSDGNMDPWWPTLAKLRAAGTRVIFIDVPGQFPSLIATASALIDFWMLCLDALGVEQVDLAVWSWSGFMAQQLTDVKHRHRIRHRVLASPGMWGPMLTPLPVLAWLSLVPRQLFPLINAIFLYRGGTLNDPNALAAIKHARPNLRAQWIQSMGAFTSLWTVEIHHPTLVLFAHDDPLVPAGVMWFWWLMWGDKAVFAEVEDGGHVFPHLDPETCAGLILAHLRGEYIEPNPPRLGEALCEYWLQLGRIAFAPMVIWHAAWRRTLRR